MTAYCPICQTMVDVKAVSGGSAMWAGEDDLFEPVCSECEHDELYERDQKSVFEASQGELRSEAID